MRTLALEVGSAAPLLPSFLYTLHFGNSPLSIAHFQPKRRRTYQYHPYRSEQFRRANRSEFNRLNGLDGRCASAMRPRAIVWRRCPASAALKEILAALLSSLTRTPPPRPSPLGSIAHHLSLRDTNLLPLYS